jgi:hypothetical protein
MDSLHFVCMSRVTNKVNFAARIVSEKINREKNETHFMSDKYFSKSFIGMTKQQRLDQVQFPLLLHSSFRLIPYNSTHLTPCVHYLPLTNLSFSNISDFSNVTQNIVKHNSFVQATDFPSHHKV